MHAIIAATLVLLPATAHGWFLENGTDFVVKPWSQQQTLAVRRRKRGWIVHAQDLLSIRPMTVMLMFMRMCTECVLPIAKRRY